MKVTAAELAPISRGQVVSLINWCDPAIVADLRSDALALRDSGFFSASGLSNRLPGDSNTFDAVHDRQCVTMAASLPASSAGRAARATIDEALVELGRQISAVLGRPSLALQEQYYSVSGAAATLPLHMDERHEETKGEIGWAAETRRR